MLKLKCRENLDFRQGVLPQLAKIYRPVRGFALLADAPVKVLCPWLCHKPFLCGFGHISCLGWLCGSGIGSRACCQEQSGRVLCLPEIYSEYTKYLPSSCARRLCVFRHMLGNSTPSHERFQVLQNIPSASISFPGEVTRCFVIVLQNRLHITHMFSPLFFRRQTKRWCLFQVLIKYFR